MRVPEGEFNGSDGVDLALHRMPVSADEPLEPDVLSVRDYAGVLRRRAWVVVALAVAGVLVGVLLSTTTRTRYTASAKVLLTQGGGSGVNVQEAARLTQTQAQLAGLPVVAGRVLRAAKLHDRTAQDFLNQASATADPTSDLITLSVTDPDRALAQRLAREYARQFTLYEQGLRVSVARNIRGEIAKSGGGARAHGGGRNSRNGRHQPGASNGQPSAQQLAAAGALPSGDALVVSTSDQTARVGPKPLRNGAIGLAAGLVLGLIVAFLLEALDPRIRSDRTLSGRLGVPLLGRVPVTPRRVRRRGGLVMLERPASEHADAYRSLGATLEARNLDVHAAVIAFTAADPGTRTAATLGNLAIALARAGRRILVVDLDLRRPRMHHVFKISAQPGLADVALGSAALEDALHTVEIHKPGETAIPSARSHPCTEGTLEVLTAGSVPSNVNVMELLESAAVEHVVTQLRDRAALVLLAAPALPKGDATAACQHAEAVVVSARASAVRWPALADLSEALATIAAPTLGLMTTDARLADCHRSHASRGRWRRAWRRRERWA